MDPMIKNSFFTILIYWNDNRIHLGLTKKLIFFILFPPLTEDGGALPVFGWLKRKGYKGRGQLKKNVFFRALPKSPNPPP